jgi:hypothetical protein
MIITKLIGGLGNQMFQYATGLYLSKMHEVPLFLDTSDYSPDSFRQYELDSFNIDAKIATQKDIDKFMNPKLNVFSRAIEKIKIKQNKRHIILEKSFQFRDELATATKNTYVKGHWQSYKYFDKIRNEILKSFTLKEELKNDNLLILEKIKKYSNSVSLHIRRTDYLNDKLMYALEDEYYEKSIRYLQQNLDNPHFFIFSDDTDWVRKTNILSDNFTLITINKTPQSSYKDMILISYCKHNIMANSSFSWWGAWLNQNTEKIVVAPKRWFRVGSLWYDGQKPIEDDLVPKTWNRL